MNIEATPIAGAMLVTGSAIADHRGVFQRLYCDRELANVLGSRRIVQINHSRTTQVGAVRGMHFQVSPNEETKLVRCLRGRVWDVAVDLRAGSPTFLHWHAVELSADSGRMFMIPEGCAHGFQVLESDSELLYLHTAHYAPQAEGGVRYDDPALGILWPLPVSDLSQRDRVHPLLTSDYPGILL